MKSVEVVRWEEPPSEHGNAKPKPPSKFQGVADTLRDRPGQWAVIVENITPGAAGGMTYHIKNGVGPWAPPRHFEARCVGPAGGQSSKVYARYVGEGEAVSNS